MKPGLVSAHYGRMLHGSYETRIDSDYAPQLNLNEAAVRSQIVDAEDFVAQMVKLLAQADASQGREHGAG